MSVVVAAAAVNELDPVTREWVSAATAHAHFAAPDGNRTMIALWWGLGHALLRLPHEHAAQPLTRGDGTWLSADVRLDGRRALRSALGAAGHGAPDDADDAQLLLQAHAAWGAGLLDRVAGDFAFALWDNRRQELLCACDQIGVVPLHYTRLGDQLLVASSPELLLLHPGVSDELDDEALADFLLLGQASSFGRTAFAAIKRLPPAHTLRWSNGNLEVRRYWSPPDFEPLLRLPHRSDYVERFRDALEQAVADRIDSGPLSTQLSEGSDSTTICALAQHLRASHATMEGDMRAIAVVLGDTEGAEEARYAARVADALGIEIDLIDESKLKATDPLGPPKLRTPEPTAYPWNDLDHRRVAVAANHARTCLTGLGADPLLGYVPWYWANWLAHGQITRLAATYQDQARLFSERPRPQLRTAASHAARKRRGARSAAPVWMNRSFADAVNAPARLRGVLEAPSWTWDKRALTRLPAWQSCFTWSDPSYTRLPLRVRHPMVDIRLLEFVAGLPPYPWLVRKRILRDATEGLLPTAVLKRPKANLVGAPRSSATPAIREALVALVANVPEAERYFNVQALCEAVLVPGATAWQDWLLARPLGLAYWLAHWRRPQADKAGSGRARLLEQRGRTGEPIA